MYNPIAHLPLVFQNILRWLTSKRIHPKIVFFIMGVFSTSWFLLRVIPKPSRAGYPCMQATAPFMSGFVLYLLSLGGSVVAFRRFRNSLAQKGFLLPGLFLISAIVFYLTSLILMRPSSVSGNSTHLAGEFPPNSPIGTAKGIFPGRVVWMWDQDATNQDCSNTSNNDGVINDGDDAWFMLKNNNILVIDSMVIKSLLALTGASTNARAWDTLFRYYNINQGKGDVGFSAGEKIFLKINATSAHGGLAYGRYYADLSRNDNLTINPFSAETNPYLVLVMLRQLVWVAGVPQNMIIVGDPARNIYKEFYDLWYAEFPDVCYLGNDLIHPELEIESLGRTPVALTSTDKFFFSDLGAVMPEAVTDKLFTVFEEIDYLINIPTMKAHATAGITLAAKNHFGSFPRTWAMHLHEGLMNGVDDPQRLGYGLYRIQTDIMMHDLLSGKNLLMIVDALYPSDDALAVPVKWNSIPFGGDWCSSVFMSLDPVAIESVCHDFLRTEYNGPTIATSRPNWSGVDDYLHQAADSVNWPEGIVYNPDNDATIVASLGVHEHWNDSLHKQYTRDLETGNGIEFIKVHEDNTGIQSFQKPLNIQVFPNPSVGTVHLSGQCLHTVTFKVLDLRGNQVLSGKFNSYPRTDLDIAQLPSGSYLLILISPEGVQQMKLIKI